MSASGNHFGDSGVRHLTRLLVGRLHPAESLPETKLDLTISVPEGKAGVAERSHSQEDLLTLYVYRKTDESHCRWTFLWGPKAKTKYRFSQQERERLNSKGLKII